MKYSLISRILLASILILCLWLTGCRPRNDFGPEDWYHFIPKDTAEAWINRYDLKHESNTGRKDSANLLLLSYGDSFKRGKWMMGTMMAKNEVTGFRINYGIKPNDSIVPILVGLDASGNDVYWNKPNKASPIATQTGPGPYTPGAMDLSQKEPPPPAQGIRIMLPSRFRQSQPHNNTPAAQ